MTQKKIGKNKIRVGNKTVKVSPIEDHFHLTELVEYDFDRGIIGALLLRKKDSIRIVFGFSCDGISNVISQNQIDDVFDPIENGFKDFPEKETMTIYQSLKVDDSDRVSELLDVAQQAKSKEAKLFLFSEIKNVKELSAKGLRKIVNLHIYCTYTFSKEGKKSKDLFENTLSNIENAWLSFTGEKEQRENHKLKELLEEAYTEGYENWFNLLSSKLSLNIKALKPREIWDEATKKFTTKKIPPSQILHVCEDELSITQNSNLTAVSRIFSTAPVPVADVQWVHANQKYTGVMTLIEKADAWKDKRSQLQYIWKILSKQEIYDTEVICQIKLGNVRQIRENMQSITKQALTDNQIANKSNNIDVAADLKKEKAVAAQRSLYEDEMPLKTATVFLVHRNSKKELDRACKYLSAQFQLPLELYREINIAYEIWLQSSLIHWEEMLLKPYDRQWVYSNTEIQGILPIVQPFSTDKKGVELISAEGGIPIYLDLWSRLRHILILATNRGGKGVLLAKLIIHYLARDVPMSIMDYPRPDGTSTFSFLAEFLGDEAAYFNTSVESFNIFELPDLKSLSPEDQKTRLTDFKEFLIDILQTMVIGTSIRPGVNPDTIKSILSQAVEQFYDPENLAIFNRITAAYKHGIGTPEWNEIPVLQDFIDMLSPERLKMSDPTPELLRAVEQIVVRLKYWRNGRIGRAISRPSTIRADTMLSVYAMANLNNEEDATIMTLAISMQAMRKSMSYPQSVILVDEVSILVDFDAIAKMIGRFCANGLKSGIQMILSGQDVDSIAKSRFGDKILQNIPLKLIGKIEPTAIKSMEQKLDYDNEIIRQNAGLKFNAIREYLATNWLLTADGRTNITRYFTDPILLGAVANNTDETALRAEYIAKHIDPVTGEFDKFKGLTEFSDALANKIRGN